MPEMIYTVEGIDQNGKTVEETVLSSALGATLRDTINAKGGNVKLVETPFDDEED